MIGRDSVTWREKQKEDNCNANYRRVFEASGSRQGETKWGSVASDGKGREGRSF